MRNNRDYKNFQAGGYYHIYNRGNEKLPLFKDDEDYEVFLFFMNEAFYPENVRPAVGERFRRKLLPIGAFHLHSYCLMPNHYHMLIKQNNKVPISKIISKVCTSYSKYFNKKYRRVGHLFQDAFKSVLITTYSQFLKTVEYILQNPIRAGLVTKISDYKWISGSSGSLTMTAIVQWESLSDRF